MSNVLLCLHIAAALFIGRDAWRRGRNPIVWTLLTLLPPFGILLTWPLLYILPRRIDRAAIVKATA